MEAKLSDLVCILELESDDSLDCDGWCHLSAVKQSGPLSKPFDSNEDAFGPRELLVHFPEKETEAADTLEKPQKGTNLLQHWSESCGHIHPGKLGTPGRGICSCYTQQSSL